MGERVEGFDFKPFHKEVCYEGADGGSHSCTLNPFIILTLEEEVGVGEAELQQGSDLGYGHAGSLWEGAVLLKSLFDYVDGWLYWNRCKEGLYIIGGDDVPWIQPFALELLDEVLGVFEVVWGLAYKWLDDM